MNHLQCPQCQSPFTFLNPPKKLKNCQHNICDNCLPSAPKCLIDNKRIDYRRFTAKAFIVNHELLDQIQQQTSSPKKSITSSKNEISPKKDYDTCLLHSKPADLICCVDGNLICANCALFGEHRGHSVKSCDQFLNSLTSFTEQALQIFDKLKEKQDNLNQQIIGQYIQDSCKQQKAKELKNIKQSFAKLFQKIKKAQKLAIASLDNEISKRKEFLNKQICVVDLEQKKNDWYQQVEKLGNITQQAYQFKNIKQCLKYFDEKDMQSFLLKRGEYLNLQYTAFENVAKNKIDSEINKVTTFFNQSVDKAIQQYCYFVPGLQNLQTTPSSRQKQSSFERVQKPSEDDILIDETSVKSDYSNENSRLKKQIYLKPEFQNQSQYLLHELRIPEISVIESVRSNQGSSQKQIFREKANTHQRSKSIRQRSVNDFNSSINRDILGPVQNKKRKKIGIPEKYKSIFQDLKNDRSEVIDFGGAELGDDNVLALCEYIQKTSKLRNLKLVRNKISDDVMKEIINACFCARVTSLNLGQNQLTEKSLEMLETFDLGDLRNITLSQNKINRRNVKTRLDDFIKRGITLSV